VHDLLDGEAQSARRTVPLRLRLRVVVLRGFAGAPLRERGPEPLAVPLGELLVELADLEAQGDLPIAVRRLGQLGHQLGDPPEQDRVLGLELGRPTQQFERRRAELLGVLFGTKIVAAHPVHRT
jgi:hypothetical protein